MKLRIFQSLLLTTILILAFCLSSTHAFTEKGKCAKAIDEVILNEDILGTLYYLIVGGKWLEGWGDYGTCLNDATNS